MDDKDRQKQERAHAKWSKDEGGQLGRAIATQVLVQTLGSKEHRWLNMLVSKFSLVSAML